MKAITVKQPWAQLICTGFKDIENRSWKTKFRGLVLIHAGLDKKCKPNLNREQHNALYKYYTGIGTQRRAYGAIIGNVEIVDCVINHPSIWAKKTIIEQMECPKCGCAESKYFGDGEHLCDRCKHTWWENENRPIYNWVFANPILFENPIENVKGKLSFWDYDSELLKNK